MTNPPPAEPLTAEQEAEDRKYLSLMKGSQLVAVQVAQRAWAEIDALCSRLAAVERERDVLRKAATTFLARFDELMPHVSGFVITACVRAGISDWGHGNWTNELTAFRVALAASVVTKEEE